MFNGKIFPILNSTFNRKVSRILPTLRVLTAYQYVALPFESEFTQVYFQHSCSTLKENLNSFHDSSYSNERIINGFRKHSQKLCINFLCLMVDMALISRRFVYNKVRDRSLKLNFTSY